MKEIYFGRAKWLKRRDNACRSVGYFAQVQTVARNGFDLKGNKKSENQLSHTSSIIGFNLICKAFGDGGEEGIGNSLTFAPSTKVIGRDTCTAASTPLS